MKKTLLITGVLLALTATAASAAGINLYWNQCSNGGATAKTFACNTNNSAFVMYASFDPPSGLTRVVANGLILDLQSASNPLPPWWQFKNVGTCRQASMIAASTGPTEFNCTDPWQGQGGSGATHDLYATNFGGNPSRARIASSISVGSGFATAVDAGTEYYSMTLTITAAKTLGATACAGCADPVCVVLNELQIGQVAGTAGGSPILNNPLTSNFVTWQGGAIGGAGCPGATPTVNRTWGQVKSIYR